MGNEKQGVSNTQETKVAVEGYNALAIESLREAMSSEECAGMQFSFDRVTVPTGGSTTFEIPNGDTTEARQDLTGVIIFNHPNFAYYKEKYTGAQVPPNCYSIDGVIGVGEPGGECKDCPYNKYGSGENNSKACKNKRTIYLMIENELFPITLTLPTGSLKSFSNYMKFNLSKGRKLSNVVTKITLKKAVNSTGISYSQCVFTFIRELKDNEIKSLSPVIDIVKDYAKSHVPMVSVEDDENEVYVDKETGEVIKPLK